MGEAAAEMLKLSINLLLHLPSLDHGVGDQVSKIKLELESMKSFVRDAERHKDGNEGLRCWVTQVMDAALKVEDVLDEFSYHLHGAKRGGFMGLLHKALSLPKEKWRRYQTVNQLRKIKDEIEEIAKRGKRYDLISHIEEDPCAHHSINYAQNIGETAFFVDGAELVGIEEKSDQLLKWLTEGEQQRNVISIVGMGGSGKTTLAAHAYNSHAVKKHFDCSAWLSVSQNYTIEDLLRKIIKELSNARSDFPSGVLSVKDYKQLVETLANFLNDKRYIIVLDDVWSNLWKQVSVAFPGQKNGSRVLITTRKEDIASYPYGAGSHVLHCKPLSNDEAWTLFCNKAFCNEASSSCPPELEDIARALVAKCAGLPLAILALGGLMASKDRSDLKWKEVYNSLNWHISNNSMLDEVKTVLLLSFKELPYFLKNCFLYCCHFPIEQWVGGGRLIRMWMAEGFLEERKGLAPEDLGKIYLRELISRSLIQVHRHKNLLRCIKLCKLHDLMWELARLVSERENFLSVCDPQDLGDEIKSRRLSFHAINSTLRLGQDMRYLRSFSAFNVTNTVPLDNLLPNFKLLRVLELMDAPICYIPKTLGKLFNLRYLGLKGTKITELPTSVGRLRNLQTLDVRNTLVKVLPKEIGMLHKLRHLLLNADAGGEGFCYIIGVRVPKSILQLGQLQVVKCLVANSDIVKGIGELTQLRRLELTNLKESYGGDLCDSIEKMKKLRHLLLMAIDEYQYLQVEQLSSTPSVLRKLTLAGRLSDVPRWFVSLRNVKHLHLHWSQLTKDPIPCISKLPFLERLILINAFIQDKKQLCFNEGLPKLEYLHLGYFPELDEILISEGVMPNLVRMNLHDCPKLKRLPQGIEHLRCVEKLHLKNVSEELIGCIYGKESVDHSRVEHIPEKIHE